MESCDLALWLRKDGASGTRLQMRIDLSMAAGHARYSAHMAQSPMSALVGPKGPAEVGGAETFVDTSRLRTKPLRRRTRSRAAEPAFTAAPVLWFAEEDSL